MTDSIVSLEREVCSCAELLVLYFVTEAENKHIRRRARFQKHGYASCRQGFPTVQGKSLKEIHAILTETIGERAPSYATVKNWLSSSNMEIFPRVMRIELAKQNRDSPIAYWSNS